MSRQLPLDTFNLVGRNWKVEQTRRVFLKTHFAGNYRQALIECYDSQQGAPVGGIKNQSTGQRTTKPDSAPRNQAHPQPTGHS